MAPIGVEVGTPVGITVDSGDREKVWRNHLLALRRRMIMLAKEVIIPRVDKVGIPIPGTIEFDHTKIPVYAIEKDSKPWAAMFEYDIREKPFLRSGLPEMRGIGLGDGTFFSGVLSDGLVSELNTIAATRIRTEYELIEGANELGVATVPVDTEFSLGGSKYKIIRLEMGHSEGESDMTEHELISRVEQFTVIDRLLWKNINMVLAPYLPRELLREEEKKQTN